MSIDIVVKTCELISFIIIVLLVGILIAYNDINNPRNWLNRIKSWIDKKVNGHKYWQWSKKPYIITKSLLVIGAILGLVNIIATW